MLQPGPKIISLSLSDSLFFKIFYLLFLSTTAVVNVILLPSVLARIDLIEVFDALLKLTRCLGYRNVLFDWQITVLTSIRRKEKLFFHLIREVIT